MMRRRLALPSIAIVACLCCCPGVLSADELWQVSGGSTAFSFDRAQLERLGLEVSSAGAPIDSEPGAATAFVIDPDSTLAFSIEGGSLAAFLGGQIRHIGGLSIKGAHGSVHLGTLTLRQVRGEAGGDHWVVQDAAGQAAGLILNRAKAGFDTASSALTIHSPELRISPAMARKLGDPNLSHAVLGTLTVNMAAQWAGGDAPASGHTAPLDGNRGPRASGCNVAFCELHTFAQYGRTLDVVGLSVATTSWNVGTEDCIWYPIPNEQHPFIVMNLYRLKADRLEQIGQSWVKHGFYALGNTQCGGSCTFEPGHGPGNWLGTGCTDTYGSSLNAVQSGMGPRYEVNPWTGGWTYAGSHNSASHGHNSTGVEHRLQVHDDDLDPAQNIGATYFCEGYYIMLDDVNVMNSAAWKPVTVSGAPGGTWSLGMSGASTLPTSGFALNNWLPGAMRTFLAQELPVVEFTSPDGRCLLVAKSTDLGGGTWHYEYALLNIDMDRKVDVFSLPVAPGLAITNIGFHAVEHHDEGVAGYTNAAWTQTVTGTEITWSTLDNPLRWGTLYNYWFDADAPPSPFNVTVTLGVFEPGTPTEITGMTVGPLAGIVDCNGNGIPDSCDINCGAPGCSSPCGGSSDCNGDGVPDECDPPLSIPTFVAVLVGSNTDPLDTCMSDTNGDGNPDGADIPSYVDRLMNP